MVIYQIAIKGFIAITPRSTLDLLLYSHKDINNTSNTNTYTNSGELCLFGYERVNQFLASVLGDTRRETQFLKAYAIHTMLTPTPNTWCILWCLRSLSVEIKKKKKNSTARLNDRKLNYFFSKSSNSLDHIFWA